jgi:hypothetical protein
VDRQQAELMREAARLGWHDRVAEVNPGRAGLMLGFGNPVTRKEMAWATNGPCQGVEWAMRGKSNRAARGENREEKKKGAGLALRKQPKRLLGTKSPFYFQTLL